MLLHRGDVSYELGWGSTSESAPIVAPARNSTPRTVAMVAD